MVAYILLVKSAGKYWHMDYRYADKCKVLAISVYPAVALADAQKKQDEARELIAKDIDPSLEGIVTRCLAQRAMHRI
ncbi:Arm DNA-binding domain-containing protein [Nitrosomonas sp. Nm132]|uniref:Arm DNA-binding domain-containing protein n=1 Tax=Nitrosomonas sp. Nm132 TaxID=1881053 RepID=UPI0035263E1A